MKYKLTDYHVHSTWSLDVPSKGPKFKDYIKIAEEHEINVCFLEHYELYYIERDKNTQFANEGIYDYLEEIDELKETYNFILSGLEIDYYQDKEDDLREFMDDHHKDLDFIAGTIHEWIPNYPVTLREKLLELLEKIPMKRIIDEYFEIYKKMLESKIFKNVCHIDTIFRYINNNDIKPEKDCDVSDERVFELGKLCLNNKIHLEYNLSGLKYPIKRPFPSENVALKLKEKGVKFFIGSDSHSIEQFEKAIPELEKASKKLNLI